MWQVRLVLMLFTYFFQLRNDYSTGYSDFRSTLKMNLLNACAVLLLSVVLLLTSPAAAKMRSDPEQSEVK